MACSPPKATAGARHAKKRKQVVAMDCTVNASVMSERYTLYRAASVAIPTPNDSTRGNLAADSVRQDQTPQRARAGEMQGCYRCGDFFIPISGALIPPTPPLSPSSALAPLTMSNTAKIRAWDFKMRAMLGEWSFSLCVRLSDPRSSVCLKAQLLIRRKWFLARNRINL